MLSVEVKWPKAVASSRVKKALLVVFSMLLLGGCATFAVIQLDNLYGKPEVRDRVVAASSGEPLYHRDIKPILDKRCVVCHGCYDAPCQLKMSSFEGIDRGASKALVYDGARLRSANLTRLFEDASSTQQWRDDGFFPVLNDRQQSPEANLVASSFYRMLAMKRNHPLPSQDILPEAFDFRLNRDQQCAKIEDFDSFEAKYPLWGMPYGLPGLSDAEFTRVSQWLQAGAKTTAQPSLSRAYQVEIDQWEAYLNGDSLKQQLVARYIYEHLFIANVYFPNVEPITADKRMFFKLVRSSTPTGQPVKRISTRRPFDDPKVSRVYYRFVSETETITAKSHMPYKLDLQRKARWDELFVDADYQVDQLPSYDPVASANPFDAFEQLPVASRYKFMLDEAQYTISGFIRGPVCRGQIALNVIHDHFWVVFTDPNNQRMDHAASVLSEKKDYLLLPAGDGSDGLPLARWMKYSALQREYNEVRLKRLNSIFPSSNDVTLDLIWDGDGGKNTNAALTVFRHFDSATVAKGHVGNYPKTTWLISYTLLERIHYLLVAGFDVYGNVSHQLLTRLYMDFLRMEAETNFLNFLPAKEGEAQLAHWYRDSEARVVQYLDYMRLRDDGETGIEYQTDNPKRELYDLIHQHLGRGIVPDDPINRGTNDEGDTQHLALQVLAGIRGESLTRMPELAMLRVKRSSGEFDLYTLLRNVSHTNVSHIFGEVKRVVAQEQTLTVVPGVLGAYPNLMFDITQDELADFVAGVASLTDEHSFTVLVDRFGMRRSNPDFWDYSDWLYARYLQQQPVEAGLLDYNRLNNQ